MSGCWKNKKRNKDRGKLRRYVEMDFKKFSELCPWYKRVPDYFYPMCSITIDDCNEYGPCEEEECGLWYTMTQYEKLKQK